MTDARRAIGEAGERYAEQLLVSRGCVVLDRNWRCRVGELDRVVRDGDGVVRFVEVRTRTGSGYGTPAESVTPRKRQRLRRVATQWLCAHPGPPAREVAFDVVAVDLADPERPRLDLLEDVI